MASQRVICLLAVLAIGVTSASYTMAEPAITTYGQRNAEAPGQLSLFSFLVGKWKGVAKVRLDDGRDAEFEWTWIGRYVLDGMAIADELHVVGSDGSAYLGITLRHFDAVKRSWIIEFLNVSNSFLRRQVNPQSGSVSLDAGTIVIISEDAQTRIRENYRVVDQNHFTYSLGDPVSIEMTMERVE
jgi:hypothetical protein